MRRSTVLLAAGLAVAGAAATWFTLTRPPPLAILEPIVVSQAFEEVADTLHQGETISEVFDRQGVIGLDLKSFPDNSTLDPRRVRAGVVFHFTRALTEAAPSLVRVRPDPDRILEFERVAGAWQAAVDSIAWRSEVVRVQGPIDNSLYLALDASVPDSMLDETERVRLAWALADIYAWTVDFTRDIRSGDEFQVVFVREVSEEGEVRYGSVLASDLTVTGRHLPAFRFDDDGRPAYYDQEGRSLRRAFLRAPVSFRRISSRFTSSRKHPILGYSRAHKGVDFAADAGTMVHATSDGVVRRAGWAGGYGNMVEIRHKNGITTRYGHLRAIKKGIAPGRRVVQGDVIGYVGMTGLANGPHLHYEFRVNGVARNPLGMDMGSGEPIAAADQPAFERELSQLEYLLYPPSREAVAQAGQ